MPQWRISATVEVVIEAESGTEAESMLLSTRNWEDFEVIDHDEAALEDDDA